MDFELVRKRLEIIFVCLKLKINTHGKYQGTEFGIGFDSPVDLKFQ